MMFLFGLFIWLSPFNTLMTYMVFGSDFFLFRWTDDLGIWFITQATSKWTFITHVAFTLTLLTLGITWSEPIQIYTSIFYALFAAGLEYHAWTVGVDAARRIDPSWNEHRGLLYPPAFYDWGWVAEYEPYEEEETEKKENGFGDSTDIATL